MVFSNNISYPVSLLIDEARMPQEIPVSHTTNVFTTLLSYISEGINSKISAFRGFNKENENQKIIINEVFSTEDATLDKTTWQHPVLTEIIEETNYNDLHVYQAYKASYKNNTLTIK